MLAPAGAAARKLGDGVCIETATGCGGGLEESVSCCFWKPARSLVAESRAMMEEGRLLFKRSLQGAYCCNP